MDSTRRKVSATPLCESLEGRRLLAAGAAQGVPPVATGGAADVSAPGGSGGSTQDSTGFGPHGGSFGRGGGPERIAGLQRDPLGLGDAAGGFGGDMIRSYGREARLGGSGRAGAMAPNAGGDSSAFQADLTKLRTDEQAIHDKSTVTPVMEAKVRNDIQAIKGAETTTADPSALANLQKDLKAIGANPGGPTDARFAQIQSDQVAVYKSQGVSDGLTTQLVTDMTAVRTAAGVTDADRATLAADQEAIQADRPAAPTGTASTPPASPLSTSDASVTQAPNAPPQQAATPASPPATATATATPTTPPATPATPAAVAVATPMNQGMAHFGHSMHGNGHGFGRNGGRSSRRR